ncbi:MAG: MBL fold metallo-hydrolase [Acidimicrobiia bacterium]
MPTETRTETDEIAEGIYRFSTAVALPDGTMFGFNQFLVDAEEPLLFHCGMRGLFPDVSAALAGVMAPERVRWISFGHVEADECASMNQWLAASPLATVVHGQVGCMVSIEDMADRPPRALADREVLDLGGRRIQLLATPHVPHNWEAIMLYESETRTLFSGDLGSNGHRQAITGDDIAEAAIEGERHFPGVSSLSPTTGPTIRAVAELRPATVAVMHGASFGGDGGALLERMADGYDALHDEARS